MYSRCAVGVLPQEALLDVRVLVDDAGLERREVRSGRRRERHERLLERVEPAAPSAL